MATSIRNNPKLIGSRSNCQIADSRHWNSGSAMELILSIYWVRGCVNSSNHCSLPSEPPCKMAHKGLATTVISKAASEAVAMASFSSQTIAAKHW
jgi:hypothetical protein